ncbi:MAG: T9SS type B sorting domain-containing protein, partial [Gammaproteobacteria bacterium]
STDILDVSRSATPDMGAYEFAAPGCVNPPVAGTTLVVPAFGACLESPVSLTLNGNSPIGSLTFQWQSSIDGTTWSNISGILYTPDYDTLTTTNTWYRAGVTCNGVTTYSTPLQITLGNILPAGTYTIGNGATTYPGGTNFQTFAEAVNAMLCGIGGKIVFNVNAGTYNEQIRIPYIPGTSAVRTVTFQSGNGTASAATLSFASTSPSANYTLKLDSTKNFIFRNMSFASAGTTYGRAIEIAGNASNDSIVNCIVTMPSVTVASNNVSGVYAFAFKGTNIVLKGNTFNNGSHGIFFTGTGVGNNLTEGHIIDSNMVNGAYNYGIYAGFQKAVNIRGNTVSVDASLNALGYGIYATDCDSSFVITGNKVKINNTTTTVYGIYINGSDSSVTAQGQILNNIVSATGTNSGNNYGLYINNSHGHNAINNVISLNNTGSLSYGLFTNSQAANYWNNSVNLTSTSPTNGYAAYFQNSATSLLNRTASFWDMNSIVYQPAFAAGTDLQPALADPNVWAMHGRGVQIAANTRDINNKARPTTLTTGVPDLGAYEFFPTAQPTVLTPVPATPAPNATQVFMYGTDTVMKVTWGATAPPDVTAQRYSGVPPAGAKPSADSMFFYTKLQSSVPGNFPYKMELFYIDPWQGSIPDQHQIGLGKTTPGNSWVVGFNSRVDTRRKLINESNLTYYDKFTGFVNPYAPPILPDKDSSNRGRRFWVAYPVNQLAGGQEMVLYLSAQETANVQVKINGTGWVRNYTVPANTVKVSDLIPKTGANNAFINTPGLSARGISIESDVPIVAYAHVYGSASSGATMLMPVGVWGYEYSTLGITQDYGASSYAYYYVIADNDGTTVQITSTPGIALQNPGMTPGTPYVVTLNKGEFYQVVASSQTEELSGSIIRSVPNAQGKCYPIATFSGSSRTAIDIPCAGGGDFIMQQNFPSTAWGKRYLTAPSSASTAANNLQGNVYRVAVKDPATVVKRNGVTLTGITNNFYYQFVSSTADYIEADKPIMVAQYLSGSCTGVGDPEMIYLSPIEQGIDNIGFYRNNNEDIDVNYLTLIVPSGGTGLTSLKIVDGSTTVTPDYTYPHPQNGLLGQNYTVVVKRWTSAQQQVRVTSDSAFTAITYGLGSVESYGYNAGTLVKNLNSLGQITNTLNTSGNTTEFTCVGSPFKFTALLPLVPTSLTWKFSAVPGLSPNADVTVANPVPSGTIVINRTTYYIFPVNQNFTFAGPGVYGVQISYSHPDIESCDKTRNDVIYVQVLPAPKTNFTITPASVCEGGTVQFGGESTTENGITLNNWNWTFHDNSTKSGQYVTFTYPTAGTYDVKLHTVTPDGCLGDSVKKVTVNTTPTVNVVTDLISLCKGSDTVLRVQNPVAGVTYNWYTAATGGTAVATNQSTLSLTNITANASYYVEAVTAAGCISAQRKKVDISVLPLLTTPVVTVSGVTPNTITFSWQPVTGAASYQVSVNNGVTWTAPSSGTAGTTHVVTGLTSFQEVKLLVRAVGTNSCQTSADANATGKTISSELFIPNTFTPNGDGRNDVLMVMGYGIKDMQMMVFNQWGEKIFETKSQASGWDGTYKGKPQPSGVYMYVSKFTLLDGSVIEKKGSINLIR